VNFQFVIGIVLAFSQAKPTEMSGMDVGNNILISAEV
jgi:hypothetical protein